MSISCSDCSWEGLLRGAACECFGTEHPLLIEKTQRHGNQEEIYKRDLLASTEIPAEYIDPTSIDLTPLVNTLIHSTQLGSSQLFSLLSVTSHSSLALHKLTLLVYNISNFRSIADNMFPRRYCYCVTNETNDLTDFTAILLDVMGNSTSYLQELFKSSSILSVSQNNISDCIYICVMAGKSDKYLSQLWEVDSIMPLFNQTITESAHKVESTPLHMRAATVLKDDPEDEVLGDPCGGGGILSEEKGPKCPSPEPSIFPPDRTPSSPRGTNQNHIRLDLNKNSTHHNHTLTDYKDQDQNYRSTDLNISSSYHYKQNYSPNDPNYSPSDHNHSPTNHNQSPTVHNHSPTKPTNHIYSPTNHSPTNYSFTNPSPTAYNYSPTHHNHSPTNHNYSPTNHDHSHANCSSTNSNLSATDQSPIIHNHRPTDHNSSTDYNHTTTDHSPTQPTTGPPATGQAITTTPQLHTAQQTTTTTQLTTTTAPWTITNITTTATRVITKAPITEKPGCPWRRPVLTNIEDWRDNSITSSTTTVSAHKLQPCVLELCKFFSQCLCHSYSYKTHMKRYCADSHLWYEKHTFEVCRRVRRVSFSRNLKQRCLARMCNKLWPEWKRDRESGIY
ncbi:HERV-H LTR-associating protein 1 [Oncorhynchus masou masou]|uniref:HERV-H LTR-associating protein 1 n=1 Tax=Oncorhynchus masou masou TaxID=90313 RepID=UPI0031835A56